MFDTEMKLDERDSKLLEIHSEMFPFVHYGCDEDGTWYIKSCDYDEEFWHYEQFIEYIETEIKESLLIYALNGELGMLAQALGEEI